MVIYGAHRILLPVLDASCDGGHELRSDGKRCDTRPHHTSSKHHEACVSYGYDTSSLLARGIIRPCLILFNTHCADAYTTTSQFVLPHPTHVYTSVRSAPYVSMRPCVHVCMSMTLYYIIFNKAHHYYYNCNDFRLCYVMLCYVMLCYDDDDDDYHY